jgi:hypothetical protein
MVGLIASLFCLHYRFEIIGNCNLNICRCNFTSRFDYSFSSHSLLFVHLNFKAHYSQRG